MSFWSRSVPLSVVLISSLVSAQALVVAAPVTLDPLAARQFEQALLRARTEVPSVFAAVKGVVARADQFDAKRRGRYFALTPQLRDLARSAQGKPGVALALLEPVVHPERFVMPTKESALVSLRAGLIEAAGDLKDPLVAPVLRGVLTQSTRFHDVRAATEALGKLGLEEDVTALSRLATTEGPMQDAVLTGLGSCRRLTAVKALAAVAASKPKTERAMIVAQALGRLAGSWVLRIPNAAPAAELESIRSQSAAAAVTLFVSATEKSARDAASDAVVTIDAAETPALIAAARTSATQAELDSLLHRFERHPVGGAR